MAVTRGVREFVDHFDRAQAFTTTPGYNGWTIKDTSSAGAPTYLCVTENGGGAKLTLAANSEAEIVTLFMNNVLIYDLADLQLIEFIVKVAGIDAVTTLVLGVASAQNDTADSVAQHAWFRMQGSVSTSNLVLETDDATNDNNDVASSDTLAATYKRLTMDFTAGLSDVRFYSDGGRRGEGTKFDMSDVTAGQNVQPFVQLQKASGTGVPSCTIAQFRARYNYAYGA